MAKEKRETAKRERDNTGLMIRMSRQQLERVKLAAKAELMPAVTWARRVLLKAAGKAPKGE